MSWILKWIWAPSGQQVQLQSAEMWYVRWQSRYGVWQTCRQPEVQVFPSKESAEHFKKQLEAAFTLLKHTGDGTEVTLEKA